MENQRFSVIYGLIRNQNVCYLVFQPITKFPKLGTGKYFFNPTGVRVECVIFIIPVSSYC